MNSLLKNSSVFKNDAGLLYVFLQKNEEKPASLSPARKGKAVTGRQGGPHLLSPVTCTTCSLTPILLLEQAPGGPFGAGLWAVSHGHSPSLPGDPTCPRAKDHLGH